MDGNEAGYGGTLRRSARDRRHRRRRFEDQMDGPLKDGQLALDGGQTIALTGGADNVYRGTIHMEKDGAYHVPRR